MIEEKDELIKKLTQKLDEEKEMNYMMQEKELYAKMELEKRDIRFKELEKEVKKKTAPGSGVKTKDSESENKTEIFRRLKEDLNQVDVE